MKINTKGIAILVFGIIVPLILLSQAYLGLSSLKNDINTINYFSNELSHSSTKDKSTKPPSEDSNNIVNFLVEGKKHITSDNDYFLLSLLITESANQKTMINKQVMKVSIMQIGFSVMSLGMMFIIMGFNDGGAVAGASSGKFSFNFKTGSSGVVIFIVGAAMSTAGGVLRNEYSTVPIPNYFSTDTSTKKYMDSINSFKYCSKQTDFEKCFTNRFQKINNGELK